MYNVSFTLGSLINQTEATKMNDLYQRTYMDYNKEERMDSDNIKGIIAGIVLFAMYAFVSTMDYQDCLRGATSC
jgi:rhamnogalacturonyl hydrolase YesR